MKRKLILLTGEPGLGKTTVLTRAVELLRAKGLRVGGIYSKEVRKGNVRVGFEIIDVATGVRGTLASTLLNVGPRFGRYRINLKDLSELAARALTRAIEESDVIVCDEIGPMELYSPEFRRAVKTIIKSEKPVVGIIHKRLRDPLAEELRSSSNAEVIEVTVQNRDYLPKVIAEKVSSE